MTWAVSLPTSAIAGLGPLRFLAGAEACRAGDVIWLRGTELSNADELKLRQLTGAGRFNVNPQGEIIPANSRLPVGTLPSIGWMKLDKFLEPNLPEMRYVAGSFSQLQLSLVRDLQEREVAALLTTFDAWCEYALTAPQARLAPLKIATTDHNGLTPARSPIVLIIGKPLPPVTGERFWEQQGIFVAAGWHWSPAVDPQTARRALGLQPGDIALWHADGQWELIRTSDLTPARRAAVRATAEELAHDSR